MKTIGLNPSLYQLNLFNSMAKEQISSSGFIYVLVRIILVNVTVSPKKKTSKNQWLNNPPPPCHRALFLTYLGNKQDTR